MVNQQPEGRRPAMNEMTAADFERQITGFMAREGVKTWTLEVTATTELTPRMRRISFTSPSFDDFDYTPGQDMMLVFPRGEETTRRRYTIRSFDHARRSLDIDFVMHGDGPAVRWAAAAKAGDTIDAAGPRGAIVLSEDADWHLFAGDETAIPAFFAMMEAVPSNVPAFAFVVVEGAEDELPFDVPAAASRSVSWLRRGTSAEARERALADALAMAALPPGRGYAYLAGEVGMVAEAQRVLLERGMDGERIAPKAYWAHGRANARHGEPLKQPS